MSKSKKALLGVEPEINSAIYHSIYGMNVDPDARLLAFENIRHNVERVVTPAIYGVFLAVREVVERES